jgi:hypothetical protein
MTPESSVIRIIIITAVALLALRGPGESYSDVIPLRLSGAAEGRIVPPSG